MRPPLFLLAAVAFFCPSTPAAGGEDPIEMIRAEVERIDRAEFAKQVLVKQKGAWVAASESARDGLEPPVERAEIYRDGKRRIRKAVYEIEQRGSYRVEEYFWRTGKLFFFFAKDVRGGTGDGFEVRLYYDRGRLVRSLAQVDLRDYRGRPHRIERGRLAQPDDLGAHRTAEALRRELGLE
ncbi:MAG: hypothetical protein JXR96_00490 [Deltaproteobacteria bacterium]|nr:hypothetical protein [Deltaproteobacteria bacterium]